MGSERMVHHGCGVMWRAVDSGCTNTHKLEIEVRIRHRRHVCSVGYGDFNFASGVHA